jgi:hypothetical protein
MILEATVYQVLGLRKAGRKDPQQFELILKDLDNKDRGYFQTTRYGTEPQLRTILQAGGMLESEIDSLFERAIR